MLTPDQEKWLQTLSTDQQVVIVTFDNTTEEKYQKIKSKIQAKLGTHVDVWHRGSSSLGISGQDEIDVYVPVEPESFDAMITLLENMFGSPRSILPLQRARFQTHVDDKKIDLFVSNKRHPDWINGVRFELICKAKSYILQQYEELKWKMNGKSIQEFYREKAIFIDQVLSENL